MNISAKYEHFILSFARKRSTSFWSKDDDESHQATCSCPGVYTLRARVSTHVEQREREREEAKNAETAARTLLCNRISLEVPRTIRRSYHPGVILRVLRTRSRSCYCPLPYIRVQNNAKRGIDRARRSQTLEILRWTYDPSKWKLEKDSSSKATVNSPRPAMVSCFCEVITKYFQ